MSATEELRAMLNERGVKWLPIAWNPKRETFYHASNGVGFCADEYTDGVKIYTDATITPEQAIAATLGRGMCRFRTVERFIDARRSRADMCECDRCGYRCARGFIQDERFKFCPNCGAKVVDA